MMMTTFAFRKKILSHYRSHGRELPWRETRDPYRILVSELMLQQTQVSRVGSFYEKFIKRFPDFKSLAKAKTAEVLRLWQGLGYNRRALALHQLAHVIVKDHGAWLPRDRAMLESLPGIGSYTAGAIRAFAFDEPDVLIETNVRRVFIHFFFPKRRNVRDEEIKELVAHTLDKKDPRGWYYALMDYGAMLGVQARSGNAKNANRRSAHYTKQSKFIGSDREIRGKILRLLLVKKKISLAEMMDMIPVSEIRLRKIMSALAREGFIKEKNNLLNFA